MSEPGWREFVAADDVDDWVVLHGGPTAVFRVASLVEAARLAAAVAEVPGLEPRTMLTVSADFLTVKLTREMWGTEARHIDVARTISALARARGAKSDRSAVQEVQVAVAALPDAIDLGFWRAVLGYAPLHEDNCIDPLGQGSTVWMQDLDPRQVPAPCDARRRVGGAGPCRGAGPGGGLRWWTTRRRRARGSSRIARATRCASPPGQTVRPRPSRMVHERPDPGLRGLERRDPTGPVGPLASDWHEATPPVRNAALKPALSESWRSAATARQALRGQDTLHCIRVPIRTQSVTGAGSPAERAGSTAEPAPVTPQDVACWTAERKSRSRYRSSQ